MKVFTVYTLAAIVVSIVCQTPTPRSDGWLKIAEECKKKSSANDDDIKSVINRHIPKTKEAACFLACTKKKTGVMTADNKVNMDEVIENLSPLKNTDKALYDKILIIFQECKSVETNEPDECVAAKNFASCVIPKKEAILKT